MLLKRTGMISVLCKTILVYQERVLLLNCLLSPKKQRLAALDLGTDVVVPIYCGAELDEVLDHLEVHVAHCDAQSLFNDNM